MSSWIHAPKLGFRPGSPFRSNDAWRQPSIFDQINENNACGMINFVPVEGRSQSGKSTLGWWICTRYDPSPVLVYTADELLDLMDNYTRRFEAGDRTMLYKWVMFDEPQQEAFNKRESDARADAIVQVVNGFGFLKQNLCVCLPDLGEIGKHIYTTNLTIRIVIKVRRKHGQVYRTGYVYQGSKPIWETKWKWYDKGYFRIPWIDLPAGYMPRKTDNFKDKLGRWRDDLERLKRLERRRLGKKEYDPYAPPETAGDWKE